MSSVNADAIGNQRMHSKNVRMQPANIFSRVARYQ